jgi:translocation and assembly module TamA
MALISVELAYQITPQWAVAVFSDAGDAAATRRDFRLRYGSGIGARWRSPVGQMNVDLARGHETGETRLHFSVGYGF